MGEKGRLQTSQLQRVVRVSRKTPPKPTLEPGVDINVLLGCTLALRYLPIVHRVSMYGRKITVMRPSA